MTRQLCVSLIALFLVAGQLQAQSPTIENVSQVVVKTTPEAGRSGVDVGTTEIRVRFSKKMMGHQLVGGESERRVVPEDQRETSL